MGLNFIYALIFIILTVPTQSNEALNKLKELQDWHNKGLITVEEYKQGKKSILESYSSRTSVSPRSTENNSFVKDIPVENLIAVVPFYGKVYSDGDRDTIAKFTTKNIVQYMERKNYKLNHGVLDFHKAKGYLLEDLRLIDPDESYSNEFLAQVSKTLKVRYVFFGNIHHYSFDKQVYRFNVECKVYDAVQNKVVFNKRARQSSRKKFFDAYIAKEKGKTIGKISEQFYFFIDRLSKNLSMQEHPYEARRN